MGKRVGTAVWLENQKRWQIKVQKDGQRRTFTSSRPGRGGQREANGKADAWLDDNLESPNIRVEAVKESFLAATNQRGGACNYVKEEGNLRNHILPQIGHFKWANLRANHLQSVVDMATGKGLSKGTVRGIKATLSAYVKFARKAGLTVLTMEDITMSKALRYKPKKILQPNAFLILLNSSKTTWRGKEIEDEYIHAYRFQALTGMRPGELIGMQLSDIHGKVVKLQRSINQYGETTKGKNDNALREYVMPELAYQEFCSQLKEHPPTGKDGSIWGIRRETHYYKRWKKYCETNGIEPVPPYRLRHTFTSLQKELPLEQLKAQLGHSAVFDTIGVYGVNVFGEMEKRAKMIDEIFDVWLQYAEKQNTGSDETDKQEQA